MNNLLGKYFPLADEPSTEELYNLEVSDKVGVRAMATGEMREPRKGDMVLVGRNYRGVSRKQRSCD